MSKAFPNLDRFIAAYESGDADNACLALGADVLSAAWQEAENLPGWQPVVYEYLYAVESGRGLNRPLGESGAQDA